MYVLHIYKHMYTHTCTHAHRQAEQLSKQAAALEQLAGSVAAAEQLKSRVAALEADAATRDKVPISEYPRSDRKALSGVSDWVDSTQSLVPGLYWKTSPWYNLNCTKGLGGIHPVPET